jgi:hypothetical protein
MLRCSEFGDVNEQSGKLGRWRRLLQRLFLTWLMALTASKLCGGWRDNLRREAHLQHWLWECERPGRRHALRRRQPDYDGRQRRGSIYDPLQHCDLRHERHSLRFGLGLCQHQFLKTRGPHIAELLSQLQLWERRQLHDHPPFRRVQLRPRPLSLLLEYKTAQLRPASD